MNVNPVSSLNKAESLRLVWRLPGRVTRTWYFKDIPDPTEREGRESPSWLALFNIIPDMWLCGGYVEPFRISRQQ